MKDDDIELKLTGDITKQLSPEMKALVEGKPDAMKDLYDKVVPLMPNFVEIDNDSD